MSMRVMQPPPPSTVGTVPLAISNYGALDSHDTGPFDTYRPGHLEQVIDEFKRTLPCPTNACKGEDVARAVYAFANMIRSNSTRVKPETDAWGNTSYKVVSNDYRHIEHPCWSISKWNYNEVPRYGLVDPPPGSMVWVPPSRAPSEFRNPPPPPPPQRKSMPDLLSVVSAAATTAPPSAPRVQVATPAPSMPLSNIATPLSVSTARTVPGSHPAASYSRDWLAAQITPSTTAHWTVGADGKWVVNLFNPGNGLYNGRINADPTDDLGGRLSLPNTLAVDSVVEDDEEEEEEQAAQTSQRGQATWEEVQKTLASVLEQFQAFQDSQAPTKTVRFAEAPITSATSCAQSTTPRRRGLRPSSAMRSTVQSH